MHNLLPLPDDDEYTSLHLNHLSAFSFVSSLGQINKMIRFLKNILSQYCRHLLKQNQHFNVLPKLLKGIEIVGQQKYEILKVIYITIKY